MTINKQWPARRKIVSVAAPLEQLVVCQLRGKTFLFQTKNRCKLLGFSLFLKAAEHQEITKQLFKKRKLWSINGLWQGCSKNVSFEGKKEENEKKNYDPKLPLEHHMAPQTQLSKWRKIRKLNFSCIPTTHYIPECSTVLCSRRLVLGFEFDWKRMNVPD